jgi:hypothetical protein
MEGARRCDGQVVSYTDAAWRAGRQAATWCCCATRAWAQRREQDHVADAGAVGQQHHQAVDADAAAAGGRHAVFQRAHKVVVVVHGFVVAAVLGGHLGMKRAAWSSASFSSLKPLPNSRPVM